MDFLPPLPPPLLTFSIAALQKDSKEKTAKGAQECGELDQICDLADLTHTRS